MRTSNVDEITVARRPFRVEFLAGREQNDLVRLRNQAVAVDRHVPGLEPLIESSNAQTRDGRERRASNAAQGLALFICLAVELESRASTPDRAFGHDFGWIGVGARVKRSQGQEGRKQKITCFRHRLCSPKSITSC